MVSTTNTRDEIEDLLEDKHVRQNLRNEIEDADRPGNTEEVWKTLFMVAVSEDGLSHKHIAAELGKSVRYAERATEIFRNMEPQIIRKSETDPRRYVVDLQNLKKLEGNKRKVRRLMDKYVQREGASA